MSENKIFITKKGVERPKRRIQELEDEYWKVSKSKGKAAELGGNVWHDNPASEEVELKQRILIKQIADLKEQFRKAVLIEDKDENKKEVVSIGSTVEVKLEDGRVMKFKITGYAEADPAKGLISYQSPLGACLMGKRVGSVFEYRTGDKITKVSIKNIFSF